MELLAILATFFGSAMAAVNFIQAYRVFSRKSAGDLSGITWSVYVIGATIWLIYGISIKDYPVIIANAIGVVSTTTTLIGWIMYREKK